ncbi:MAG: AMP-binding protein [Pseudomonadota bacterium]
MAGDTLISLFHNMVAKKKGRTALRKKEFGIWNPISWNEYNDHVKHFCLGMRSLGLKVEDKVGILGEPRPEWLYAELATQTARAVVVGLYSTSPPPQIHYVLQHSEAKFVIAEDQEQVDKVLEIKDDLPCLKRIIFMDPKGLRHYDDPILIGFENVEELGREVEEREPGLYDELAAQVKEDDIAMIIYTSGTTGNPKGAMISHRNIVAMINDMAKITGMNERDSVVSYLPLNHIAEQIFSVFIPLKVGAVCNFAESIETVNDNIREISPTIFLGVPRIWEKMQSNILVMMERSTPLKRLLFGLFMIPGERVAEKKFSKERIGILLRVLYYIAYLGLYRALQDKIGLMRGKLLVSGAAAIGPDVVRFFHAIGLNVVQAYGMTETAGLTFIHQDGKVKLDTVGKNIPSLSVRLAEDGEILKKGESVFVGYFKDPEGTATVKKDGWLHTGDIGEFDEDGQLKIVDRKKDLIVTPGGKNIAPQYIENKLKFSPYIGEAIIIGEKRKYIAALVQIDLDMVSEWAMEQKISFTTYTDLSRKPEVYELIAEEVRKVNNTLSRVETIKKFLVLEKMLDHDDEELTATMKIRRKRLMELYKEKIDEVYKSGYNV